MMGPAYILRPIYPVLSRPFDKLSFFGGAPLMPRSMAWPRTADGTPMSFLGQVALESLPQDFVLEDGTEVQVDLLPGEGVLYVFAELAEWGAFEGVEGTVAVLWSPETRGLREMPPPEDLSGHWQPQTGVWQEESFPERAPKLAPKAPLTVVPYNSMPQFNQLRINMEHQANREDRDLVDARELSGDWQQQALERLFGPRGPGLFAGEPVIELGIPWAGIGAAEETQEKEVWDLPESWPWAWLMIDCTAQAVVHQARRRPAWAPFIDAARDWIARADRAGPYEPVPRREAQAFRDWTRDLAFAPDTGGASSAAPAASAEELARYGLKTSVRSHLERLIGWPLRRRPALPQGRPPQGFHLSDAIRDGMTAALPYLLASPARKHLPKALIPLLASWFDTRFRGHEVHQMLGAPWSVQNVAETHADRVMLFQFVPDERLGWQWGDLGTLQIWITEEDLRARRFDRIEHTLESH